MGGASYVAVAVGSDRLVAAPKSSDLKLLLNGGGSIRVRQGPRTWQATLSNCDSNLGLCWLQVEGLDAPAVSLRQSATLRVGERLFCLGVQDEGAPLRETEGAVTSLLAFGESRVIKVKDEIFEAFRGGVLFDVEGRLVGLGQGLFFWPRTRAYAAPAEWMMDWRSGLLRQEEFLSVDLADCPRWHATAWKDIGS